MKLQAGLKNAKISICKLIWLFYQYFNIKNKYKKSLFGGLQISAPQSIAMLVSSLPRAGKKMAHDALDTFTTDSNLVQNVTYTACWVQNGSTHGHIFTISIHHLLTNRTIH